MEEAYHMGSARFLDELYWYDYDVRNARSQPCARSECAGESLVGTGKAS